MSLAYSGAGPASTTGATFYACPAGAETTQGPATTPTTSYLPDAPACTGSWCAPIGTVTDQFTEYLNLTSRPSISPPEPKLTSTPTISTANSTSPAQESDPEQQPCKTQGDTYNYYTSGEPCSNKSSTGWRDSLAIAAGSIAGFNLMVTAGTTYALRRLPWGKFRKPTEEEYAARSNVQRWMYARLHERTGVLSDFHDYFGKPVGATQSWQEWGFSMATTAITKAYNAWNYVESQIPESVKEGASGVYVRASDWYYGAGRSTSGGDAGEEAAKGSGQSSAVLDSVISAM